MALREDTRRVRAFLRSSTLAAESGKQLPGSVPSSVEKDDSLKPALMRAKQEYRARGKTVPRVSRQQQPGLDGGKVGGFIAIDADSLSPRRVEGFQSPAPSERSDGAPSARSSPDISVGPGDASGLDMSRDSAKGSSLKLPRKQHNVGTSTGADSSKALKENAAPVNDGVKRSIVWG